MTHVIENFSWMKKPTEYLTDETHFIAQTWGEYDCGLKYFTTVDLPTDITVMTPTKGSLEMFYEPFGTKFIS